MCRWRFALVATETQCCPDNLRLLQVASSTQYMIRSSSSAQGLLLRCTKCATERADKILQQNFFRRKSTMTCGERVRQFPWMSMHPPHFSLQTCTSVPGPQSDSVTDPRPQHRSGVSLCSCRRNWSNRQALPPQSIYMLHLFAAAFKLELVSKLRKDGTVVS